MIKLAELVLSVNDAGSLVPIDEREDVLEQYRHTAVAVLLAHSHIGATCDACHSAWPCSAVCAAENVLEW